MSRGGGGLVELSNVCFNTFMTRVVNASLFAFLKMPHNVQIFSLSF